MKVFSLFSLFAVGLTTACSVEQAVQPNLLLILTDDQGWGDFGFNGNSVIQTPVLDSLCNRSAHFTNFYVSPLSASTRAGLLTGRDHLRTGAMSVTRSSENMTPLETTIAEVFKANNYTTGCFGKWHNGAHYPQDPNGQGFDEFVGFCAGHLTNYFDSRLQRNQEFFNASGYITDVLTDEAINFIDSNIKSDKPFFCYVPYNAPHAPYQVPDKYYNRYANLDIEGGDMTPAVYAMCENIDYNVGRLLSHLEDTGVLENTVVVFMTDNGPNNPRYNGNLRGKKGEMHEGGFKVPCLVYWQGHIVAKEIDNTASYVDIMPTIIDLCKLDNVPSDREMTGVTLAPLIYDDKAILEDRYLFTHRSTTDRDLNPYNGVVYNDRYKLITFENGRHELYDKKLDPKESNNLIDKRGDLASEMIKVYDNWFSDVIPEYDSSISRTAHVGILDTPVELPSHEALMSGNCRYFTNIHGWAGDWIVDMKKDDSIYWDIIVDAEGDYSITLQYSSINNPHYVSVNGNKMVKLTSHKPIRIDSPDRSPRVEAYEQIWAREDIGVIHLRKGENKIELKFNSNDEIINGELEVKAIEVSKVLDLSGELINN